MEKLANRSLVDANARLLKADWTAEIDAGVKHVIPLIKRVFRPDGLLGFIADPFLELAAVAFLRSSRKIGIKQMDITLQCAVEAIESGNTDIIIEKHARKFVGLDEMAEYGRKSHPLYKDLVKSLDAEFTLRVQETIGLLSARSPGGAAFTSVPEIYQAAYNHDANRAREIHERELGYIEERIRMVKEHEDLIEIPFGLRDKVLRVVTEGLQFTKDRYQLVFQRWFP
jgi:hypothetical protein